MSDMNESLVAHVLSTRHSYDDWSLRAKIHTALVHGSPTGSPQLMQSCHQRIHVYRQPFQVTLISTSAHKNPLSTRQVLFLNTNLNPASTVIYTTPTRPSWTTKPAPPSPP